MHLQIKIILSLALISHVCVANAAQEAKCYLSGTYNRLAYSTTVLMLGTKDAAEVEYKLNNIRLRYVTWESRWRDSAKINAIYVVANAAQKSGQSPAKKLWSLSIPINVVTLSSNHTTQTLDDIEFRIPNDVLESADYVSFAFKSNEEIWPTGIQLKYVSELTGKTPVACPEYGAEYARELIDVAYL